MKTTVKRKTDGNSSNNYDFWQTTIHQFFLNTQIHDIYDIFDCVYKRMNKWILVVLRGHFYFCVPCRCMVPRWCSTTSQEGEMLQIKFVLNTFFHDVLYDWSPARHLVSLFGDTFLTRYLVNFLSITLETVCHESHTLNWTF